MEKTPNPMTLAEAATVADLSPDTLRWQIHNGRIKATKRGRDWMVSRKELAAYLRSVGRT